LVANNNANFSKKATGKITFSCEDGQRIREAIDQTVATGEGQTCWMRSVGLNEEGVVVSTFNFEWAVKLRR
ncbi:MAG: thioesterase, partial [Flavobacteriaceae bacterium]